MTALKTSSSLRNCQETEFLLDDRPCITERKQEVGFSRIDNLVLPAIAQERLRFVNKETPRVHLMWIGSRRIDDALPYLFHKFTI